MSKVCDANVDHVVIEDDDDPVRGHDGQVAGDSAVLADDVPHAPGLSLFLTFFLQDTVDFAQLLGKRLVPDSVEAAHLKQSCLALFVPLPLVKILWRLRKPIINSKNRKEDELGPPSQPCVRSRNSADSELFRG